MWVLILEKISRRRFMEFDIPEETTLSMSMFRLCDMKPRTLNITRPARELVMESIQTRPIASLNRENINVYEMTRLQARR